MMATMTPVVLHGLYEVRPDGGVVSLRKGRHLKPIAQANGYVHVTLRAPGVNRQVGVHVLIAECFLGTRPQGHVVNHKNGIKTDNRVSNLEWVTPSENVTHAYRHGLRTINQAHRERCAAMGRAKRKAAP